MGEQYKELIGKLNPKYLKLNEPLSLHTTVGIGGPADIWYEAQSTEEFIEAINLARKLEIPVTILGRGSNVLISDSGIRGLVLKNGSKNIVIGSEVSVKETEELEKEVTKIEARWASDSEKGTFKYEFKDLDYDELDSPRIEVKIDSGVDMAFAINFLINKGITGLQWYARIPGNLGGWIYNNVHGGTHFINELIKSVDVLTENGAVITLKVSDLNFGYDVSRFHNSNEII
ncbi:FAD-binding protein, partial [Candidatus Dojkabacteria bacterium]|nr:FAD-binding protein [Candidatus Dojkabacteria bacterium]